MTRVTVSLVKRNLERADVPADVKAGLAVHRAIEHSRYSAQRWAVSHVGSGMLAVSAPSRCLAVAGRELLLRLTDWETFPSEPKAAQKAAYVIGEPAVKIRRGIWTVHECAAIDGTRLTNRTALARLQAVIGGAP